MEIFCLAFTDNIRGDYSANAEEAFKHQEDAVASGINLINSRLEECLKFDPDVNEETKELLKDGIFEILPSRDITNIFYFRQENPEDIFFIVQIQRVQLHSSVIKYQPFNYYEKNCH